MTRKRTSPIWKISKKTLEKVVKNSETITEILKYFGFAHKGCGYKTLKNRLKEDNIDYSHIPLGRESRKGRYFGGLKAKPLEEVMVENSIYGRGHLKNRLIKEGILENKCCNCGLEPEWDGKKLVMVLDHINGTSDDHRLENLRLLCPNCNSQTDTFAGRRFKLHNNCIDCKKEICLKSTRCIECYNIYVDKIGKPNIKKIEWPPKEELQKEIDTMSWEAIGRKYGVSGNAVKKWAKSYDIEIKRKNFPVPEKECPVCNKIFKNDNKNQIYCSKKCSDEKKREHIPEKGILLEKICLIGIEKTSKFFNVSNHAIRNWLVFHDLPTNIKEIKNWPN